MVVFANQAGASGLRRGRSNGNKRREPGFECPDRSIRERDWQIRRKRGIGQIELERKINIGFDNGVLKVAIEHTIAGPQSERERRTIRQTYTRTAAGLLRMTE